MRFHPIPVWKEAPFLRLLIPFSAGILLQWHFRIEAVTGYFGTTFSVILLALFSFKSISNRFRRSWLSGIFLNCAFFCMGLMLTVSKVKTSNKALSYNKEWDGSTIIARLEEPLSEKPKSFKAISSIQLFLNKRSVLTPEDRIIIYFQKDSAAGREPRSWLRYGSCIIFKKNLQPIRSSGNPGSFDYRRFCAFQNIFNQVYLKTNEYKILAAPPVNPFKETVFSIRRTIISILRQYIPGNKESGLAEALLIGYKDDLDKDLVQSYSNTGVVHIIAISGLHVGLIYWLLNSIILFFIKSRRLRFLKSLLIIAGLWMFCFLAGGSPSVLRSVVMFTFIVSGQSISRNISIYNSLAASAFVLLCYNPFWIWDTGFQLSYAAVLSIVIFMKPIYNSLFIENKLLDSLWKINSVTLAAQVLTLPICLYYFHQFPNFFLITNFIAVPLSSIILVGELLLCTASVLPVVATKLGFILNWLIWLMNTAIERFNRLPFSVLQDIQISILQVIAIYLIITGLSIFIIKKKTLGIAGALAGIFLFGVIRCYSEWTIKYQRKLIVYNIPSHQCIDFIEGNSYFFKGDSSLISEGSLHNFHLKPSRIFNQVRRSNSLPGLRSNQEFYRFFSRRILILEKPLTRISSQNIDVDVIVISHAPNLTINEIQKSFTCKQVVVDASNPSWKASKWKAECDSLNIPCYIVAEQGAFVMSVI